MQSNVSEEIRSCMEMSVRKEYPTSKRRQGKNISSHRNVRGGSTFGVKTCKGKRKGLVDT
jgi:hypothetical protein